MIQVKKQEKFTAIVNYIELDKMAIECGFTHCAELDISTLELKQEIRDMCNPEQCNKYNKSWSCPPACASLEEIREHLKKFKQGILVQTVGEIEDSLDWDGIMEAGKRHKENFGKMKVLLKKAHPSLFAMGAGDCRICDSCTYPDDPCRYPEEMETSMEACGLFVSKVCSDNDLDYNYGSKSIAFTSCFLL